MMAKSKMLLGFCLWTAASCRSTIHVNTRPNDADVYLARRTAGETLSGAERPDAYNYRLKGADSVRVPYFAWVQYYAWAEADGYEGKLVPVPNSVKVGPAIGCMLLLVPCLWVVGPDGGSMLDIELEPTAKTGD